jgi:uncharacterized protein DUF4189
MDLVAYTKRLSIAFMALLFMQASMHGMAAHSTARGKIYNGAIAYHRVSANYGYSVNHATARAAQVEALRQCGDAGCEIVARLRNDCGAVANGAKRFTVGKGATRQEAETKALRACGAGCEVVVWACTR